MMPGSIDSRKAILLFAAIPVGALIVVAIFMWTEDRESTRKYRALNLVETSSWLPEDHEVDVRAVIFDHLAGAEGLDECVIEPSDLLESQESMFGNYKNGDAFEEALANAVMSLGASDHADHKFAASFFKGTSETQEEKFSLIGAAYEANPTDPMVLNRLYRFCLQVGFNQQCDFDGLERQLIDADGDNSESWILIMLRRQNTGDMDGALAALRRATTSPGFNSYYSEHIGVIRRGLAAVGFGNEAQQAYVALGHALIGSYPLLEPIQSCKTMIPADARWAAYCLSYGEIIEAQGQSADAYQLGLALQRDVLRALDDSRQLALVERKLEKFQEWVHRNSDRDFDPEFYSDEALLNEYLDELDANGWHAAWERYSAARDTWYAERCAQANAAPGADAH